MNRTILFLSVLACFTMAGTDVAAQKKYNDLAVNNLYGPVKKVEAQRTVFDKDCGYSNFKLEMCFTPDGYIVKSNDFTYNYDSGRDKYVAEMDISADIGGYVCCRFSVGIEKNVRKDSGICTGVKGANLSSWNESWLSYEFDANGRLSKYLSEMIPGMDLPMWTEPAFDRTYEYKGASTVPYRVKEELDVGGDGWIHTLLYKYEGIDVKGNWTKRKVYLEKDGKLLMEESRTIEYYNPGEVDTYVRTGKYKL